MTKSEHMTISGFARAMKQPRATVRKWIADGTIPKLKNGRIDRAVGEAAVKRRLAERGEQEAKAEAAAAIRERTQLALASEREAKARLRELELRRKSGELVSLAEVIDQVNALHAAVRAGLLALAPRVAQILEAIVAGPAELRAARIEATIADEVNLLLEALKVGEAQLLEAKE